MEMGEYFLKPSFLKAKVKVELDLSNYATKTDLKMQQELIHHLLLKQTDLASLKSNVGKLDIDQLKNIPSNLSSLKSKVDKLDIGKLKVILDLSNLSNAVKSDAVKKDVYMRLNVKYLLLLT